MDEGAAISKEVADIILRMNRFTLLPAVFEEGKKIINTVGTVARLFLTKNFMVIYLSLASALLLWEFPLTPRRLGLFNTIAIGMPAILIAFTNASTERQKRLVLNLLTFVAVSALIMVSFGQIGFSLAQSRALGEKPIPSMVMLAVMVVTSVANFLLIVSRHKNRGAYALFGGFLLLLFVPVVTLPASNWLLRFLNKFYETSALNWAAWRIVLMVCAGSWAALFVAQKLRAALVNRGA
jgi:cation-transporting ATPase E